jgi:hypothetical protein
MRVTSRWYVGGATTQALLYATDVMRIVYPGIAKGVMRGWISHDVEMERERVGGWSIGDTSLAPNKARECARARYVSVMTALV